MKPPKPPLDPAWQKEIADIVPLGGKKPNLQPAPRMPAPTHPDIHSVPVPRRVAGWNDHPAFPLLSNTAECISGHAPHLEPGLFRQLGQGKLRPTAVIDLHGLGEGDAWLALVDFLHDCVTRDHRTALIIHGKGTGYGPQRNMGVIKVQIGTWLASHPKVLAFHTALPADGGTGAIYAYLRRYGK